MKTKTKERSILMNGDEVRATLACQKIQVRQVVKLPRWAKGRDIEIDEYGMAVVFDPMLETHVWINCPFAAIDAFGGDKPRYKPGSLLWVKETWRMYDDSTATRDRDAVWYRADLSGVHMTDDHRMLKTKPKVDAEDIRKYGSIDAAFDWNTSTHMPRHFSRTTLEVIRVWAERLQDIGKDGHIAHDVLAEGISRESIRHCEEFFHRDDAPVIAFSDVWDKNHKNPAHKFKANPYVFGAEYKILDKE